MNCRLYVVTWDGTELVVKPALKNELTSPLTKMLFSSQFKHNDQQRVDTVGF
jgi:hypothetical protein